MEFSVANDGMKLVTTNTNAATTGVQNGIVLIENSTQIVSKKSVNLSLVKLGPLVATILGGVFTAVTLLSVAAIVAVVVTVNIPAPPIPTPDFDATFKQVARIIFPLTNDRDPRTLPLQIKSVTQPTFGVVTFSQSRGSITYTSKHGYAGVDRFEYTVTNGYTEASTYIQVNVTNTAPVAVNQFYTVKKNVPLHAKVFEYINPQLQRGCYDADNDTLIVVGVGIPQHGTVTFDDNTVIYTPAAEFSGVDFVNYTISDRNDTASAILYFAIENLPPVAVPDMYMNLPKDTVAVFNVTQNDYDPNGDHFWIDSVYNVAQGTVIINSDGKSVTYRPGYPGQLSDSFQYIVTDGTDKSASYVVVGMVNAVPVAKAHSFTNVKNTPVSLSLANGVDFSDMNRLDTLTCSFSQAVSGQLQVQQTVTMTDLLFIDSITRVPSSVYQLVYTPNQNFVGRETITYTVVDGNSQSSASAQATLTFDFYNRAPTATNDNFIAKKNIPMELDLTENDSDIDGDAIRIVMPVNGQIVSSRGSIITLVDDHTVLYTPANAITGQDTFTYTIEDVCAGSLTATATVTITLQNAVPIGQDDSYTIQRGFTNQLLDVTSNDADENNDPLTIGNIQTKPGFKGTVRLVQNKIYYDTVPRQVYVDVFTYTVTDDSGATSTPLTVVISVVNTPPVAKDDSYRVPWRRATTLLVLSNDTDINPGDILTIADKGGNDERNLLTTSADGTHLIYTPGSGFQGSEVLYYTCSDGGNINSNEASIYITVYNTAPNAFNNSNAYDVQFRTPHTMDVVPLCNDDENDPISIQSVSTTTTANRGVAVVNNQKLVYNPNRASLGEDSFTYIISDGSLQATGSIKVNVVDNAPTCQTTPPTNINIPWRTVSRTINPITDLKLCSDPDGAVDTPYLTVSSASVASGGAGSASVSNGAILYTLPIPPYAQGFNRVSTIQYQVSDGMKTSTTYSLSVTLTNTNAPTAKVLSTQNIHWRAAASGVVIPVVSPLTDADGDGQSLVANSARGMNGQSSVTIQQPTNILYQRTSNAILSETITLDYTDGLDTNTVQVPISVFNSKPQCFNFVFNSLYWLQITGGFSTNVVASASDNDSFDVSHLKVTSCSSPTSGAIVTCTDQTNIHYSFPRSYAGNPDTVTYTISDGLESCTGTISIAPKPGDNNNLFYQVIWNQVYPSPIVFSNFLDDTFKVTFATNGSVLSNIFSKPANTDVTFTSTSVTFGTTAPFLGTSTIIMNLTDSTTNPVGKFSVLANILSTNTKPDCRATLTATGHWRSFMNTGTTFTINGIPTTDVDGDTISVTGLGTAQPAWGTISFVSGRSFRFSLGSTPQIGTVSFGIIISDGVEQCEQTVQLTLTNQAPVCTAADRNIHWRDFIDGITISSLIANNGGNVDLQSDPITVTSISALATPAWGQLIVPVDKSTVTIRANSQSEAIARIGQQNNFLITYSDSITTTNCIVRFVITNSAPSANNLHCTSPPTYDSSVLRNNGGIVFAPVISDTDPRDVPLLTITQATARLVSSTVIINSNNNTITYIPGRSTQSLFAEQIIYTISDGVSSSSATICFNIQFGNIQVSTDKFTNLHWRFNATVSINLITLNACTGLRQGEVPKIYFFNSADKPASLGPITAPQFAKVFSTPANGQFVYTVADVVGSPRTNSYTNRGDIIGFACENSDGIIATGGRFTVRISNQVPTTANVVLNPTISDRYNVNLNLTISVTGNDNDAGDVVSIHTFTPQTGAIGTLTRTGSLQFSYQLTSTNLQASSSVFSFTVTDGELISATRTITINFPNAAPTCVNQDFRSTPLIKGTTTTFTNTFQSADANNDVLRLIWNSGSAAISPSNYPLPTVSVTSATLFRFTITPPRSAAGDFSVSFFANDGRTNSPACVATFTVVNAPPVALHRTYTFDRIASNARTLDFALLDGDASNPGVISDPNGDTVTILNSFSNAQNCGAFSLSNLSVVNGGRTLRVQVPANTQFNNCRFNYVVSDGTVGSTATDGTKTVTLNTVDYTPSAVDDILTVNQGGSLTSWSVHSSLLANDLNRNADPVTAFTYSCTNPSRCQFLTLSNMVFSYTPERFTCDTLQFTYTVTFGSKAPVTATVTIKYQNCRCYTPLDIVMVLDGSSSISAENWNNMRRFGLGIINSLEVASDKVNVAVVQYADRSFITTPNAFGLTGDATTAKNTITTLVQAFGNTATRDGLKTGRQLLANTGRPGVGKVVILVTDGDANLPCNCRDCLVYENGCLASEINTKAGCFSPQDAFGIPLCKNTNTTCSQCDFVANRCMPCADPTNEANAIKSAGYKLVAMGVGNLISTEGRQLIASMNFNGQYYNAQWDSLDQAISLIVDSSCNTSS